MIQDRSDVPVVAQLNNLRAACFAPEYALRYGCRCNSLLGALRTIVRDPEPSSRLRRLFYVLPAFRLAQCLARGIRQFIALSEDTKQRYVAAGFEADHIAVVPNMYDDARFAPRAPVGQEADEVEIICVGQLDHRKGVLDLAEGFADLPDDLQQKAFLSFIGRGTEEAPLRALINWLGIKRRVQVRHTAYDSLPAVYERAHVAVLPARWPEPFGRTKLEAMAFGLPVLTSDHGSAREVLGDAAQYYTPFDVEDLTDRLAELIRDADLRRRLGTAGQARLERFSPDRIVPQVLEVYRRAGSGVRDRGSGVRGPANPNSEIRHPKSP
jgi:glycosyltransferase involved in cell wall biosynthesis